MPARLHLARARHAAVALQQLIQNFQNTNLRRFMSGRIVACRMVPGRLTEGSLLVVGVLGAGKTSVGVCACHVHVAKRGEEMVCISGETALMQDRHLLQCAALAVEVPPHTVTVTATIEDSSDLSVLRIERIVTFMCVAIVSPHVHYSRRFSLQYSYSSFSRHFGSASSMHGLGVARD